MVGTDLSVAVFVQICIIFLLQIFHLINYHHFVVCIACTSTVKKGIDDELWHR